MPAKRKSQRIDSVYLKNGGLLEHAQQMAAHESARTTKLYDRHSANNAEVKRQHRADRERELAEKTAGGGRDPGRVPAGVAAP